MQTLRVDLDERSYPIFIGSGLLHNKRCFAPYIVGKDVLIVSNDVVAPLYLQTLVTLLGEDYRVESVVLPDGESHKRLSVLNKIYDVLLQHRFSRDVTLIALGGGVVGDMTGFAAASYQRGVAFIQVPTTLLAQVDSSVGGKTGVNHALGKNMIGAFHQPRCVVADIETLNTLDDRQLKAGMAEVIKYGLIRDKAFFTWLEENMAALLARDAKALVYAIKHSCQSKANVVAEDEFESGVRAILNLGHTFGHAIETGIGYGHWLHGEAVAVGMLMAADLSLRLGALNKDDVAQVKALLLQTGLPVSSPEAMTAERYMALMASDKKVQAGQLRLVLLSALGNAEVTADYSQEHLLATLNAA